jgi:glycosyltransferase involved in cell wall biosynthesis
MPQFVMVSFLVPCFNYGHYLQECIASIQSQSFQNWELLILDDASSDETPVLAKALSASDTRIQYFQHTQNIGHLANYNFGLKQAKGELIWLISADDCLAAPDIAEEFVRQFQNNPRLGLAFCRVQCVDEKTVPYQKYIPRQPYTFLPEQPFTFSGHTFFSGLVQENFVPAPGAMAKKQCYEAVNGFNALLTHSGDWYNWLLFSLEYEVYYQPLAKVYYRKHANNMHQTYQKPDFALQNSLLCYQELDTHVKRNGYPKAIQRLVATAKNRFIKKNKLGSGLLHTLSKQVMVFLKH